MTAAGVATWLPALATIEKRARLLGAGFGVEVAPVWPLVGGVVGPELLVSAGTKDRVAVRRTACSGMRSGSGRAVSCSATTI